MQFLSAGLRQVKVMELRKLHLVVIVNLIKFGLLFQLDDIKFYKPSGETMLKILANLFHLSLSNVKRCIVMTSYGHY